MENKEYIEWIMTSNSCKKTSPNIVKLFNYITQNEKEFMFEDSIEYLYDLIIKPEFLSKRYSRDQFIKEFDHDIWHNRYIPLNYKETIMNTLWIIYKNIVEKEIKTLVITHEDIDKNFSNNLNKNYEFLDKFIKERMF